MWPLRLILAEDQKACSFVVSMAMEEKKWLNLHKNTLLRYLRVNKSLRHEISGRRCRKHFLLLMKKCQRKILLRILDQRHA